MWSILFFKYDVTKKTQNRHTLDIPVPIWSLSIFIFGNFPAKPPFFKRLPWNHTHFVEREVTQSTPQWFSRMINWLWIACNNTDITKGNSFQKIFSRSGFSAVNSLPCQNGYRALPPWFAQLCTVWGYWSRSDGHSYFANHIWPHLVMCLSKSCMPTRNFLWIWILFRRGQPLTRRSASTDPPRRCCSPWRHHPFTWFTWPPLWRAYHFPS